MTTATAPVLHFTEESHLYHLDGKRLPSVTEIMRKVGLIDFSGVPEGILEAARQRGTRVHKAAQFLTEGALDWASVDDIDRGHVEAAARFIEQSEIEILGQERRLYHPTWQYAGTCDVIAWWHDGAAVADYKTGQPEHVCAHVQLAAYSEALRALPPEEWWQWDPQTPIARLSVALRKDGTYRVERHTSPRDFSIFMSALTVYREIERLGRKRWEQ